MKAGDKQQRREEVTRLEPIAVRYETAMRMLECGRTTVWKMVKAGKLKTVKIGSDDRILVSSIRSLEQEVTS